MPLFYLPDNDPRWEQPVALPKLNIMSREAVGALTLAATCLVAIVPVVDDPAFTAAAGLVITLLGLFGVRPKVWSEETHQAEQTAAYLKGRQVGASEANRYRQV